MNRRALLAAVGVGSLGALSGCLADGSEDVEPTTSDAGSDTAEFAVEVVSAASEHPLDFTANVASDVTADTHGELALELSNAREDPLHIDGFHDVVVPFHLIWFTGTEQQRDLWSRTPRDPSNIGGCWFAPADWDDVVRTAELEPDESIEGSIGLFADVVPPEDEEAVSSDCMEAGDYVARQTYALYETDAEPHGERFADVSIELEIRLNPAE